MIYRQRLAEKPAEMQVFLIAWTAKTRFSAAASEAEKSPMKNTVSEVYNISQNVMHIQGGCRYNNKREVRVNHINNDIDHIVMRRSQNTLVVVWTGTILFSVWTVVKTLGSLFMRREETVAIARRAADEIGVVISDQNLFYIMLAILLITMLLFLGIRTYIGERRSQKGEGFREVKDISSLLWYWSLSIQQRSS